MLPKTTGGVSYSCRKGAQFSCKSSCKFMIVCPDSDSLSQITLFKLDLIRMGVFCFKHCICILFDISLKIPLHVVCSQR